MPANVNFNIPFNPGAQLGGSISEQILAGLHQGFTEKHQQKQEEMEQQRVQNETQRNQVLNRLTETQINHEAQVTAYENETNPLKKHQLLQDLQKSALDLGIAKHQAKYFGIDADALTNAAQATDTSATPTKTTSTGTAGPSPFELEMQNTEKLLGQMSPDEQAIWDNAKTVASRTMSAAPVTAAIAKISEQRQAVHKAELETTPFKTWQAAFEKEHGRKPTSQEVENFQTASSRVKIEGLGDLKSADYLDTSQSPAQVVQLTASDFRDKNKADPGRYVEYNGQTQNAMKAITLVGDIRDGITQMKEAVDGLPKGGLSSKARALMALATENPDSAKAAVVGGLASANLSKAERKYVIAHATLTERAMSLRGIQGQGAGSDSQRAAISAMLPSFSTADKDMAHDLLGTLSNNVDNVDRGIPTIGKLSRKSAKEETGGAKTGGLSPEDEAAQFLNKKP